MSCVERLLQEVSGDSNVLTMLREQPEQLGQKLGFSARQTAALLSSDHIEPMQPVTFETGTTIEA